MPRGWKFGVGVEKDGKLVGVGVASRPVSRHMDDGRTIEVIRCCTDGTKNAPSFIYGALRRAAKALGYERIITYTLVSEPGTSLRAAGWERVYETRDQDWSRSARRRWQATPDGPKVRWESRL